MALLGSILLTGCGEDDTSESTIPPPLRTITYPLTEIDDSGITGMVTFQQEADSTLTAKVTLIGPPTDHPYPSSIYTGSAAEEGKAVIDLQDVDGATLQSTTSVTGLTYEQLLAYDGHLVVQGKPGDLTIVAQADIGGNVLTGTSKQYALGAKSGSGITGTVLLEERMNGYTKATIHLENATGGATYPSHIHAHSAAEGGGIFIDLTPIEGTTGNSVTTIRTLNQPVGGASITYEQLLNFDGYINVHRSAEDLTIVSQTDIGANELTGASVSYPLDSVADSAIEGTATFAERKSGETLVTLALNNTLQDGLYPAHLHARTAVEGGQIVIDLSSVDGATGASVTNVTTLNNGTPLLYESLVRYDGHIDVLLSDEEGTDILVGQGDIGGNALTGESVTYPLDSVAYPTIRGEATFYQRSNGLTLAVIRLLGTSGGGIHPAYLHANTAAERGPSVISLNPVEGTSGLSKNSVRQFDDGTPVTYEELLTYNGHLNVDLNSIDGTLVAQGDIGQNALTGNQSVYPLVALEGGGIQGTATFAERNNGFSLVTLALTGTSPGGTYPAHIHFNSVAEGGGIAISLTNVNGTTGISKTNVESRDNNLAITYEALIAFDGHINIHLSVDALNVIVSQGDVGINARQ